MPDGPSRWPIGSRRRVRSLQSSRLHAHRTTHAANHLRRLPSAHARPRCRELRVDGGRLPAALRPMLQRGGRQPRRSAGVRARGLRTRAYGRRRGAEHEFRFRTRLFGSSAWQSTRSNCAMAARPVYEFQVIGKPDDDPGVARQAHWQDAPGPGSHPHRGHRPRPAGERSPDLARHRRQRPRTTTIVYRWSSSMVEISWDELGRMVAAFEGWQFKLEFRDRSEEV